LASSSNLSFSSYVASSGNTVPASQTISIASSGNPITFRTVVTTSTGGNWLSTTATGSTTSATVTVTADPTGLAPGYYQGVISFVAPGVTGGHQSVTVSLNVSQEYLYLSSTS